MLYYRYLSTSLLITFSTISEDKTQNPSHREVPPQSSRLCSRSTSLSRAPKKVSPKISFSKGFPSVDPLGNWAIIRAWRSWCQSTHGEAREASINRIRWIFRASAEWLCVLVYTTPPFTYPPPVSKFVSISITIWADEVAIHQNKLWYRRSTYLAVDISKGTHSSLIGQHARSFTEFGGERYGFEYLQILIIC